MTNITKLKRGPKPTPETRTDTPEPPPSERYASLAGKFPVPEAGKPWSPKHMLSLHAMLCEYWYWRLGMALQDPQKYPLRATSMHEIRAFLSDNHITADMAEDILGGLGELVGLQDYLQEAAEDIAKGGPKGGGA